MIAWRLFSRGVCVAEDICAWPASCATAPGPATKSATIARVLSCKRVSAANRGEFLRTVANRRVAIEKRTDTAQPHLSTLVTLAYVRCGPSLVPQVCSAACQDNGNSGDDR